MRRLLPEWAPQAAVLITWPHAKSDWALRLTEIEPVYVEMTKAICRDESAFILAYDESHRTAISAQLAHAGVPLSAVHFFIIKTNDSWIRDYGPLVVETATSPEYLDFRFNAWGGKYTATLDDAVTRTLAQQQAFPEMALRQQALILEGGSIETDGQGTLLTTTQCLLSPSRNPSKNRADIENTLKETLGFSRILWLTQGYLVGDDTDSHIDNLARFCDPETICYAACDDPQDAHYEPLMRMATELHSFLTSTGKPYQRIPLPIPAAQYNEMGQRLPASYLNFLITNRSVLLPIYHDPMDQIAIEKLSICFPDRNIVPIYATPLIKQFGGIHCATMQLPLWRE